MRRRRGSPRRRPANRSRRRSAPKRRRSWSSKIATGRVWATPGTTAITEKIPNDVVCSGANSSRVSSDGILRMGAKGSIANDAGIARNNTAVEGVALLEEKGVPSAAVGHHVGAARRRLEHLERRHHLGGQRARREARGQGRDDRQGSRAADARLSGRPHGSRSKNHRRSGMDRHAVRSYVYAPSAVPAKAGTQN